MNFIRKIKQRTINNALFSRIIQAISFGVFGAVGSRFFILLAGILLSRILGETLYGKYSLVHTTVLTFVSFSGLGIGATLTRYIVVHREEPEYLGKIIKTLSTFCYLMSFIVALSAIFLSSKISHLIVQNDELSIYFKSAAVSIFFSSLASIQQSILIGFERYKENAYVQFLRCILYLILSVVLSGIFGISGAILALIGADVILFIVSDWLNRKQYKKEQIALKLDLNPNIRRMLFQFTLPTFIASMLYTPTLWIANAMLTKYAGYNEMAIYAVSNQWLTILTYIPAQFGNMKPIYTELYCNKKYAQLWKSFYRISIISSGILIPFIMMGILFGRTILGLYGGGYVDGAYTFYLMLIAAAIINLQAQVGSLLQAVGKMWTGFALNLAWSMVFLGLFYVLRSNGSVGYAIAYLSAYIIHTVNSLGIIFVLLRRTKKETE